MGIAFDTTALANGEFAGGVLTAVFGDGSPVPNERKSEHQVGHGRPDSISALPRGR